MATGLLITAASFAAFYVTAPGGFLCDDFGLLDVVAHRSWPDLLGLLAAPNEPQFYRPVAFIYWKLNLSLFGLRPAGFWTLSVLNHAVNGFLVFLIVLRLAGGVRAALAAGLIFVMLPLQGEAVACLFPMFDRVCLFFVLLGVYSYIVYRGGRKATFYALSLVSFILALLSKEMAMTFPVLIALTEVSLWQRGSDKLGGAVKRFIPYLAVLGAYLLLRYSLFHGIGGYLDPQGHSRHIVGLSETLIVMASLPRYILFPANREIIGSMTWVYILFGALYAAIVVAQAVFGRTKKGPFLFGLAWIVLTLPPVMGLLPLFPTLNRGRFLYMPLVGFAIFMAGFFGSSNRTGKLADGTKTILLLSLLAGYLILDGINYSSWVKAYDIARSIPRQVVQVFPSLPPGAKVYFIGVPDNYAGAFVYRNGLDSALNMAYGYDGDRRVRVDLFMDDGHLRYTPSVSYSDLINSKGIDCYIFAYLGSYNRVVLVRGPGS